VTKRPGVKAFTAHHDAEGVYFLTSSRAVLLSPELALVDPELAAAARALVPEPRFVPPTRPRQIRRVGARSWRLDRRDLATAVVGLFAGAAIATGLARTGTPTVQATAGPAVTSPAHTPAAIRWASRGAVPYFDFVLWRDGRRILDAWPMTPNTVVPAEWTYRGKRYGLSPGRYAWFVYPGVGRRSDARYGPLTASGQFTVAAR